MSLGSALLFTWVQRARFYHGFHERAIAALPPGHGRTWIDVGCGPGLIPRLAAARGYRATGIDRDRHMVRMAQHHAIRAASPAVYRCAGLDDLASASADVVSASALLVVLADPLAGLRRLWDAVRPGGTLLVIEATARLQPANAQRYMREHGWSKPARALQLWSYVRQGRTLAPDILADLPGHRLVLLGGMVEALYVRKA